MKTWALVSLGAAALCAIAIFGASELGSKSAENRQPSARENAQDTLIEGYRNWHKVNEERMLMHPSASSLCVQTIRDGSPHTSKYITVFVNEIGKPAMLSHGNLTFPLGSIIVKEKYDSLSGGKLELLTIMVKREKGFAPSVGDWEFITASKEQRVHKEVDLSHCISCHKRRPETDYTFKSYLTHRD